MKDKNVIWYSHNKKRKYLFVKVIAGAILTGYDLDKEPFWQNDNTPCYKIHTNTEKTLFITRFDLNNLYVEILEKIMALMTLETYEMLWSNNYKKLL